MVVAVIGENCAGKSTLAEEIKSRLGGEIVSGKDYLRMAKSESEAVSLFKAKLADAVAGGNVIYVISEREHLALLPEGAVRILVSADIDTIKERFKARMRGNLPVPVEKMLETRHGSFDGGEYDLRFDGVRGDAAALCEELEKIKRS